MFNPTTNVGVASKIGIGIEPLAGVPVKATRLLDRVSGNLNMELTKINRRTLRNVTAPIGTVPGLSNTTGSIVIEPTPEGISELLCLFFGAPTSVDQAVPAAPGSVTITPSTSGSTSYTYEVRAFNSQGRSSVTIGTTAVGPTTLGGAVYNEISWAPVIGATSYSILKRISTGPDVYKMLVSGVKETLFWDFGINATVSEPSAPAAVSGVKVHTYVDTFNQLTGTICEKRGNQFFVYPGARGRSMSIRLDKTQTEPFSISCDMGALNELPYDTEAAIGIDTAGYDVLPAFGAVQAQLILGGSTNSDARTFDLTLNKNVTDRQVLNGYLGPNAQYVMNGTHTGTATLYFSDLTQMSRYFGYATAQAAPFGASRNVVYFPMQLVITSEANAAGFSNQIIIDMPLVTFERVGEPLNGPDAVMQDINFTLFNDPSLGTSVRVILVNQQTNANIITPGTPIAAVPLNDVNPYYLAS